MNVYCIRVSTSYFEEGAAGFSQPFVTDVLGWIIHCWEGGPVVVECGVTSWAVLDVSINPSLPVVAIKNVSGHWQMSSGSRVFVFVLVVCVCVFVCAHAHTRTRVASFFKRLFFFNI